MHHLGLLISQVVSACYAMMADVEGQPEVMLRAKLVAQLSMAGWIRTHSVAEAFESVARHVFLPGVDPAVAYADQAVVTHTAADGRPLSSSSQPTVMAAMLEQLAVEQGQRVLEVGTGTGYNAALLARLVGDDGAVTTIDIDRDLVQRARGHLAAAGLPDVTVVCSDGADGWRDNAPYDRIIVTAAAADLPPAWTEQLAEGGRLVVPLSLRGVQQSVAFDSVGEHLMSVSIIDCGFMPLRGALAGRDPVRTLGTAASDVAIRTFGVDGHSLAERLAAHIREWDARGRPSTCALHVRAYRQGSATGDAAITIDMPHTRFLLDWHHHERSMTSPSRGGPRH